MCPHILTMHKADAARDVTFDDGRPDRPTSPSQDGDESSKLPSDYLDGALVTAGATVAENSAVSSPDTAAGAAAPLSKPALDSAPRGEEGPLVSEADPTSNAG